MRYFPFYFTLLAFCVVSSLQALDASLSYARFLTTNGGYLEIYTHVSGQTVNWSTNEADSLLRSKVDITFVLLKGEEVIIADRFVLNSPATENRMDFVDLKRYALEPGTEYQLEARIVDAMDETNFQSYRTAIKMEHWPTVTGQSDIMLLAKVDTEQSADHPFNRHGILMEPLPYSYYGRGANILACYNEVYGTNALSSERVLVLTKIEALRNGKSTPIKAQNKVMQTAEVLPIVQQVDISRLPSGNYLLAVEVRSETNELICRREIPFQRANPLIDQEAREQLLSTVDINDEFVGAMDFDSLKYSALALLPLMPQDDVISLNEMIKAKNAEALRIYLFAFWTNEHPMSPEEGYRDFMAVANIVDRSFNSGFRNGFETDRGYVYLKYGAPSDITRVETDPTAPPYEIWSYNVIEQTNQHNTRFIFYNPSLAAEDFQLLHSDVIGEVNNPQWELMLYRNSPGEQPSDYINGTQMPDNLGRNARRILSDY